MRGQCSMTVTSSSSSGQSSRTIGNIIDPEIDEIDHPPEIHSDVMEDQVLESRKSVMMVRDHLVPSGRDVAGRDSKTTVLTCTDRDRTCS